MWQKGGRNNEKDGEAIEGKQAVAEAPTEQRIALVEVACKAPPRRAAAELWFVDSGNPPTRRKLSRCPGLAAMIYVNG
jgi:hypothetical protein